MFPCLSLPSLMPNFLYRAMNHVAIFTATPNQPRMAARNKWSRFEMIMADLFATRIEGDRFAVLPAPS
ncbi:MAG: hypothetical protein C7B43_07825 [Sulfobacillus benefaciens]|uniref:Uncharacterized protein n=1 Tax=Sulfobacillus benefaciens TaxID=453960 RepID=A0A2T2X5B3_9FIRM|nr:MAG: hypothetical protein C7B43_07825 [Sulfobacillus benefaciens]